MATFDKSMNRIRGLIRDIDEEAEVHISSHERRLSIKISDLGKNGDLRYDIGINPKKIRSQGQLDDLIGEIRSEITRS